MPTETRDPGELDAQPSAWVRTELESVRFGDERLSKRAFKIVECLAAQPQHSIPQAMGTWSNTKAAYRFLRNPKVTADKILEPHRVSTITRVASAPVVLAVQDTTELNYTHLPATEGLGTIGSSKDLRGMLVHTTIAFTPERVPLGVLAQHTWIRPAEEFGTRLVRKEGPIEEKESFKWILSLKETEEVQAQHPQVRCISVGDREADIYELFFRALRCKSGLIVRASCNRPVEDEEKCLWPYMAAQPAANTLQMQIPQKKSKKLRAATVELRFARVPLRPPTRFKASRAPIEISAVYLHEPEPPEGNEALSWMLLTTTEVNDETDAQRIVDYYSVRWSIELFHRILKSGCRIEKRQLQTAEALRNLLVIDSIVAWRIQLLTMLGRQMPDLPCDLVFEEHEWKALYCYVHKTREPPEKPPSLNEAILLVARVGGFLGRKGDGRPGTTVLWRGLQGLTWLSGAWLTFGPEAQLQSGEESP
jgi:hypothetical protein